MQVIKSHFAEYFCDLFASQYISKYSGEILDYIDHPNQTIFGVTHPSTDNRIKIVDLFLSQKRAPFLDFMLDSFERITGNEIKKRFFDLGDDAFCDLAPIKLTMQTIYHQFLLRRGNFGNKDQTKL